jgi:chain length determinant protein
MQSGNLNNEVDLFALAKKVWSYKKFIFLVTGATLLIAGLYAFAATPWYKVVTLVETGYYKNDNGEEVLVANTSEIVQKLTIKYVDLLKDVEGLECRVQKISEEKNNKKFLNIEVVAVSNDIAKEQINKIVGDLAGEHRDILNAYLEIKRVQLANIDRQINFLKNNVIIEKQQQIEYVKNIQIPRIDRQIAYMREVVISEAERNIAVIDSINIPSVETNIALNKQRLKAYEAKLEELQTNKNIKIGENLILKQMLEQGFYSQITNLEQGIISLEQQREVLLTQTRPNAQDRLDKLNSVELENMQAERDTIINDKLPTLQRELANLQTEELNKLLDQRNIVELSLNPYNYQNTQIVSDIVMSKNPVKPKKAIIIAIAFLSSLMLSIFGVLVYDSVKSRINKEKEI